MEVGGFVKRLERSDGASGLIALRSSGSLFSLLAVALGALSTMTVSLTSLVGSVAVVDLRLDVTRSTGLTLSWVGFCSAAEAFS